MEWVGKVKLGLVNSLVEGMKQGVVVVVDPIMGVAGGSVGTLTDWESVGIDPNIMDCYPPQKLK